MTSAFVRFREREQDREMEEFAAWALRNNEPCEHCNSSRKDLEIHPMGSLGRITLICSDCYREAVVRTGQYHAEMRAKAGLSINHSGGFWNWLKGLA